MHFYQNTEYHHVYFTVKSVATERLVFKVSDGMRKTQELGRFFADYAITGEISQITQV